MASLSRWNPFRELELMSDRLNRVLAWPAATGTREALTASTWAPAVDISETETEYLIKAEVPEVKKEDVKVVVQNGILSISGERKSEKEEKGKRFHRIEREYGSFMRSFQVPEDADESKVTASFKEGVLSVHLGKSDKPKPKTVSVKVQ